MSAEMRKDEKHDDNTPLGICELPQTGNLLYNKGYDQVRRPRKADFALVTIDLNVYSFYAGT